MTKIVLFFPCKICGINKFHNDTMCYKSFIGTRLGLPA